MRGSIPSRPLFAYVVPEQSKTRYDYAAFEDLRPAMREAGIRPGGYDVVILTDC
jgi:hypothetical protein